MPVNSLCEVHNVRVRNSWHRYIVKRTSFSSSKLTATRLYTDTSIVTCGAFLKCSFYAYIKLLTLGKQRTWNNSIRLLPAFRHLFPPLWFARVSFQAIPFYHTARQCSFHFLRKRKALEKDFYPYVKHIYIETIVFVFPVLFISSRYTYLSKYLHFWPDFIQGCTYIIIHIQINIPALLSVAVSCLSTLLGLIEICVVAASVMFDAHFCLTTAVTAISGS